MLFESYTSVSRLINTEPSELLCLWLSEPIASESVGYGPHLEPTCKNCHLFQPFAIFCHQSVHYAYLWTFNDLQCLPFHHILLVFFSLETVQAIYCHTV